MSTDKKRPPGKPPKGEVARTKTMVFRAMPAVARWLDDTVKKLKISRSDWLEQLYRDAQKKYPADDQHGGASP